MLYKLWEDGLVDCLDDSLEKYAVNFTIKNPMDKRGRAKSLLEKTQTNRFPGLTLRRMASQLSGNSNICSNDSHFWFSYINLIPLSSSAKFSVIK